MPPVPPMATAGFRPGLPAVWRRVACAQCRRALSASPAAASGHNRWSKIRHEKGAADAKKTALRTGFTKTITLYSQMYGPEVGLNPQLAAVVAQAKKAGVPKTVIEGAIARGQGRSAAGARLETATYELLMPPAVALVVDLETESKARALQDLNALVRRKGGTATPTKFFFTRRGRVVLGAQEEADESSESAAALPPPPPPPSADDILEDAIEAGAEDVETDEASGNILVWTPPNQTAGVVAAVAAKHPRLAVLSADNSVYASNEDTRAPIAKGGDDLRKLVDLLAALRAYPDVRAVYANAVQGAAPDETWAQIEKDLDW